MKLSNILNNPWLVLGTIASIFWWTIENKHLIPDEVEPQTVWEDQQKYAPLEKELLALGADMADRNIPWARKQLVEIEQGLVTEYTEEQIYNYLCGTMEREGQYRRYERIHGAKHFTEGDYCE